MKRAKKSIEGWNKMSKSCLTTLSGRFVNIAFPQNFLQLDFILKCNKLFQFNYFG